ncbi:MAG: NADH-quinone oxidoreductase subunit J [Planctomycetota bacterium]
MDFASPTLDSLLLPAQSNPFSGASLALTVAAAISAAGLGLLMQPGRKGLRIAGTVIGLAGFAMLMVEVLKRAGEAEGAPPVFPVIFGFIALAGAVRLITHSRPVFAALYFILVVIATAGMFLLLGAEFMAFSLIIVYAGAILITYMFVLMLAQQSPVPGVGDAWYDRQPREAFWAVLVGFVMLATLSDAYFSAKSQSFRADAEARSEAEGMRSQWLRLEAMPKLLLETTQKAHLAAWKSAGPGESKAEPVASLVAASDGSFVRFAGSDAMVEAKFADGSTATVVLPPSLAPDNSRQVGVDLVSRFPASLEIAGVVLLMALFGAVILARRQIELGEDERRELAGLRRLTVDGEPGGGR